MMRMMSMVMMVMKSIMMMVMKKLIMMVMMKVMMMVRMMLNSGMIFMMTMETKTKGQIYPSQAKECFDVE